jgi:hypothetical protein
VIRNLLYELRRELKYVPDEPALDASLRSSRRSTLAVAASDGGSGRGEGRVVCFVEAKASAIGIGLPDMSLVGSSIPHASVYSLVHATTSGWSLLPNLLSAERIATTASQR